jgi:hypothetical protein
MRLAFVVQLGNDSRPAETEFEGWVQEVDSSIELRFRSTEDLLRFLGQRFVAATQQSPGLTARRRAKLDSSEGEN